MSIVLRARIVCDLESEFCEVGHYYDPISESVDSVYTRLTARGWKFGKLRDLCPHCAKVQSEKAPRQVSMSRLRACLAGALAQVKVTPCSKAKCAAGRDLATTGTAPARTVVQKL